MSRPQGLRPHDGSWCADDGRESPIAPDGRRSRADVPHDGGPYSSGTSENSQNPRKRVGDVHQPAEADGTAINAAEKSAVGLDGDDDSDKKGHPNILRGYRNAFVPRSKHRRKHPRVFRPAGWVYDSPESHRHKDSMQRISRGAVDDRYISPYDARVKKLVVQTVDGIYRSQDQNSTWDRTFVRNVTPWHLRLAYWPTDHLDPDEEDVTLGQKMLVWAKWVPTTALLFIAVRCFEAAEGIRCLVHILMAMADQLSR